MKRIVGTLSIVFLLACGASEALAQDGSTKAPLQEKWTNITNSHVRNDVLATADPHAGSQTWLSEPPDVQLASDKSLNTVSRGGIFVPTMTAGISEPRFQVRDAENNIVSEAYNGTVAYVPPGDYTVVVGSMASAERLEFDVHVVDGATTTIPVEWSGLLVKVVDDRGSMIRGNYEIISMPDRGYIGLGTGALLNEGERYSTWILWPGSYMIISVGEGYQARKNFITVDLHPGELTRLTLVLDEDTGDILGGGEIEDINQNDADKWWDANLLVGGSVRFNSTDNVIGKANGQVFDISAFVESSFNMLLNKNFFYARLNAEIGGSIRVDDRPFITTVDELNLELLYAYRVVDWFGPYIRFAFESNMAPSQQEFASSYTVQTLDADGLVVSSESDKLDTKLSPPFSPITLKAGAGARFDASFGYWFNFNARVGVAYRHVLTRDLFVVESLDEDERIATLVPVDSQYQFGAEAAVNFELTPVQWFTLKADFSVLEPFVDYTHPVVDLDLDAAFRISSIASLSYSLKLTYDAQMIDKVQLDQYVQLRFSYKVF